MLRTEDREIISHSRHAQAEFRPNLVGVVVVEPTEDVQCLHPCPPGGTAFTDGVVDVTEAVEAVGFAI